MNLQRHWMNKRDSNSLTNKFTYALFVIYLLALFWILLLKFGVRFSYMENRSVNLIPFREIFISNGNIDAGEIILNVLIFIPLGIYAGVLFRRWTFWKKLFLFFLISAIFEGLQFMMSIGAFDITDTITNTSGGIIGLMIFKAIEKLFSTGLKAQKFINVVAATGTVLMILLLVLLKLNMLPIRYQ